MTTTGTVRFTPRPPEDADDPALAGRAGHDGERPRTGFVLMPRAVLHQTGLSRDARLLYAVLQSYAWQQGSCFPSHQRLKADLGCGINQVSTYLRELEDAGLVTRRRRGLGHSTIYTLHDPAPAESTQGRADDPTDRATGQDEPPAQTHRNGGTNKTQGNITQENNITRWRHHPQTATSAPAPLMMLSSLR